MDTGNFRIALSFAVKEQIAAFVHGVTTEIAWVGLADVDVDGYIRVGELWLPPQEVSAGHVDEDEREPALHTFAEFLREQGRSEDCSRIRYFGHSHVEMGVFFSTIDTGTMKRHVNTQVKGMEQIRWLASTVHNKKNEVKGAVSMYIPSLGQMTLDAPVVDTIDPDVWEATQEAIKFNVKEIRYTKRGRNSTYNVYDEKGNYVGYGSYGGWHDHYKEPALNDDDKRLLKKLEDDDKFRRKHGD